MSNEFLATACRIYHVLTDCKKPVSVAQIAVLLGFVHGGNPANATDGLCQHLHNILVEMAKVRIVVGFCDEKLEGTAEHIHPSHSQWLTFDDYLKKQE
jgi:hypothetical protein